MTVPTTPIPARLTVVPWPDPVIDALGFAPHHPYSELVATGTLGPSTVLCWRRLAGTLLHHPQGTTVDVADLATALGLGHRGGAHGPMPHTLRRMVRFHLGVFTSADTLAVRRHIAPLTLRQLAAMPADVRRLHDLFVSAHCGDTNGSGPPGPLATAHS